MGFRGIHHVEFSVLDYDNAIAFCDRMFGWLGHKSFWTLDIGCRREKIRPHPAVGCGLPHHPPVRDPQSATRYRTRLHGPACT